MHARAVVVWHMLLLLTGWATHPLLGMAIVAAREGDTGLSAFEPDVVFRPGTLFTLAALHMRHALAAWTSQRRAPIKHAVMESPDSCT